MLGLRGVRRVWVDVESDCTHEAVADLADFLVVDLDHGCVFGWFGVWAGGLE
jgi:hypothetical protein